MSEEDLADSSLTTEGGEDHSMEHLGHRMFSKADLDFHTEINNPEADTTLDVAADGLIWDEFKGTGFEKDIKLWKKRKRVNYVPFKRKRAGEGERMVEASAQAQANQNPLQKLIGDVNK